MSPELPNITGLKLMDILFGVIEAVAPSGPLGDKMWGFIGALYQIVLVVGDFLAGCSSQDTSFLIAMSVIFSLAIMLSLFLAVTIAAIGTPLALIAAFLLPMAVGYLGETTKNWLLTKPKCRGR